MKHDFNCPVCSNKQWQALASKTYAAEDVLHSDAYSRIRYQVLFDIWLSGQKQFILSVMICQTCGFVCFSPRPDAYDIENKYRFLNNHPEAKLEFSLDLKSDRKRSQELHRIIEPYLNSNSTQILDFGGGKGRLLYKFVESGHHCAVLDLVDDVIAGVEYAGSELSDITENKRYDLIICSHVIEHLADPLATIMSLKDHLAKDGFVYVEVPSEIWRTLPPRMDPVTHINFFTTDSLTTLLQVAGIYPLRCFYETFTRPNGKVAMGIKAIGSVNEFSNDEITYSGTKMVDQMINATLYDRMRRMLNHPKLLKNLFL